MKNETPCNVFFYVISWLFCGCFTFASPSSFPCRNSVMRSCSVVSFNSLNIVRCVSKTCLNCRIILIHHLYTKLLEPSRMFWKFQGVFFYYYSGDPAKFRNHDLRTSEKRGVTVFSIMPLSRPLRYNVRISTIIFFLYVEPVSSYKAAIPPLVRCLRLPV